MKRPISIISIFLLVLLFIACEKTPDKQYPESTSISQEASVKSNERELAEQSKESESSEKSHVDEKSIELISLEEARKEAAEICGQTVEGFVLPDKIPVTESDTITVYKSEEHKEEVYTTVESRLKNICSRYDDFVNHGTVARYYEDEKTGDYKLGVTYHIKETDENRQVCTIMQNGFMYISPTVYCSGEPIERYDIEWGDYYDENEGFELSDGFLSIKDAVGYTERTINDNLGILYKGVTEFKVQHLFVFRNEENDKYVYKIIVGLVFDGQPLDTSNLYFNTVHNEESFIAGGQAVIFTMEQTGVFNAVSTCNASLDFNKTETIDRIISPKTALKLARKELALGGIDGFEQAGLVSFFLGKDYNYGEEATEEEKKEFGMMRPYWVFTNSRKDLLDTDGNYDCHENTVFVDAVSGEVVFCNSSSVAPY